MSPTHPQVARSFTSSFAEHPRCRAVQSTCQGRRAADVLQQRNWDVCERQPLVRSQEAGDCPCVGHGGRQVCRSLDCSSAIFNLFLILSNLQKIVQSAYQWLSENYRRGDRIYLFGAFLCASSEHNIIDSSRKRVLSRSISGADYSWYDTHGNADPKLIHAITLKTLSF